MPAVLALVLAAASALALWRLLGTGAVTAAALPPAPSSVGSLVDALAADWVPSGLGTPGAADPALWPLLVLSLPFASPALALTVLLVAAPPLAALSAWWGAGALSRSPWWRALAALAWAGAPVLLLSTSSGRYGAVLAHLALPVAARLVAHAAATPHRRLSWAWSATAALALVPVVTGAPLLLLPAALAGLVAAVVSARPAPALVAVPAAALLLPTLGEAVRLPAVLMAAPGTPVAGTAPQAWQVLLGWPLAPGSTAVSDLPPLLLLAVGAVPALLAVVALGWSWTATPRGLAVRFGVGTAALGTALAGLAAGTVVGIGPDALPVTGSAAPGTSLALLGLLVAGLGGLGAQPAPGPAPVAGPAARRPRRSTVVAVLVPAAVLLLALAPVAATTGWVLDQLSSPAAQDLTRTAGSTVPAVVADAADSPDQVRSLVVRPEPGGAPAASAGEAVTQVPALQVALVRGTGPALDRSAAAAQVRQAYSPALQDPAAKALDLAVADLVTGRGDARAALAPFGVGAVVLLLPSDPRDPGADALAARLDAVEGLTPAGETGTARAWRVQPVTDAGAAAADRPAAVRLLPVPDAAGDPAAPAWQALPSTPRGLDAAVPAGAAGRVVALAERAHPAWTATLDGRPLERVTLEGWAQGFVLPAEGGQVLVQHDPASGPVLLGWQLVVLLVTVLLAVPVRPGRARAGGSTR